MVRRLVVRLAVAAVMPWSIRVEAAEPHVVATSPTRYTFAPATTAISITFDQPLLHSSVTIVYKNADASATGTTAIKLRAGALDGAASIKLKAKGGKVGMPDLSAITGPLVVQLQRSGGAPCFGTTYSAPFTKSDATIFKDKDD